MLQKLGFLPGFNKQVTSTGAESQWTGGTNVRFRYGTPEKIGGWNQLGDSKLTGAARGLHHMVNKQGIKYAIIGTNRILYAYSGEVFYDIHPLVNPTGTVITSAFSTTNGSPTVTLTFGGSHTFEEGDIILFGEASTFSAITGSNFGASDFADKKFMVTSVVSSTQITITMSSNETGSGATTSGGITFFQYYHVGPAEQVGVFGWGISQFGGTSTAPQTTTLNGSLSANSSGTGGTGTSIVLTSVLNFPTTGTNFIQVGTEEISYTGVNTTTNTLTGITRNVRGTTNASHSSGDTVTDYSSFSGWGQSSADTDTVAEPGLWALDNLGSTLIALIFNGECFEWNADLTNATGTRATIITGAPTASRDMLVSTPDRHLVFFGTETTIGDKTTQDDMFIRFSSQENINEYIPTAENSAGTQRLAAGSRIMGGKLGRNAIYIWTDTSLFTMRFVGTPFTFAFEQVGTNCGLIGMNASVEVDGAAYWMSDNGFFRYTGKLESLDCLVEDFVYDDINLTPKEHINAGLNNLFGEVMWFYPNAASGTVNRMVSYNYIDSTPQRPVWTTGTLARTSWQDSAVFGKPHASEYNSSGTTPSTSKDHVIGCTDGTSTYYEHETGTDQVKEGQTSAIAASIESGDFDIGQQGLEGDGEFMMKIRRVIPDFLSQTGDSVVTLNLRDFPNDTQASSTLGPFTISSGTQKIDTRARARSISLKVANTSTSQFWRLGTFRLDIQPDGRR